VSGIIGALTFRLAQSDISEIEKLLKQEVAA